MLLRATLLSFTLLLAQPGTAAPLTILAEEWPPFVYLNALDQPAGMAVDIVQQLQQRTGDTAPMQLKPWDQANALLHSQPDHMMFTLGDTDDNRRDFTQLGPIMIASVTAYSLSRHAAALASLPAARLAGESTVTAQDSIAEAAALEAGFRPHRTRDREQGLRLLLANRVRLWVEANTAVAPLLRFTGTQAQAIAPVSTLSSLPLYLSFSRGTAPDTVRRWQRALEGMLQDGSYLAIHLRWLPLEDPVEQVALHSHDPALAPPATLPGEPPSDASGTAPALP
ncbi:transporter substrate-binding domain-containing protein [Vogesella sp. DC21W]|uniref:Transporter substrate-binding domain-containing protein n=1 Tax=Vogesella aquatica TaxID=2984206 RepID=A0ABT5IZ34_9NEIS|nr:transporter substrate-binding domain-containing protein [Vogesella aquatica]MDC7717826.1 transporter substrate-binding domain-containing protein [Vogesella aquatica]